MRALALLGVVVLLSLEAEAQTTLHYREGQRVEPEVARRILERPAGTTRSIRVLESGSEGQSPAAEANALSLPVHFDFDSAAIAPSAREQLDALAEGIKQLPPGRRVIIEGHTDAVGSDDYNEQLSRRRAGAVKQYLVQTHGIDARLLRDTGVGKRAPIPGTDPYAAENRRVQFQGG
jgi:OmpA-OmpF porin, OOP family